MLLLPSLALAVDGTVTLPLTDWTSLLDAGQSSAQRPAAPVPWLQVDRAVEGSFERGVFTGTLRTTVRVLRAEEGLRIPVITSGVSIARVELDGHSTALLPEGGNYTVGIATAGAHTLRVDFFLGQEDDRFVRRLELPLPPSGPTRVSVVVPEVGIEATLENGAMRSQRPEAGGTRIDGQLDGQGLLRLSWKGRAADDTVPVKAETREFALFTLHDALVKGVATFDTTILEGETDRLSLRVPDGVEIVEVSGADVLQWRNDAGLIDVRLRYLVSERANVQVLFQFPVSLEAPVALRMPLPAAGTPFTGAIGVQGPAGFEAAVEGADGTSPLRDLPPELAALTANPLLLGFELAGEPDVRLRVSRQAEVAVASTAIDELEATTVLIEDGAEITRMQLHVHNQTQQYLGVRRPDGAVLTHARLDGRSIRPAMSPDGATLLLPLIQSERLADGETLRWQVREGDTLGGLADRFYGDPTQWQRLIDNNYGVLSRPGDLATGQDLVIAPASDGAAAVDRFVIDLAWTRDRGAMGLLGARALTLPEVDATVAAVEWDVYVPSAVAPLHFAGSLSPYSHIRYDHIRRAQQFLDLVLGTRSAWAGMDSGSYSSILSRRKAIYRDESEVERQTQEASSTFPLVGERHRFKRTLPGRDVPTLSLTWMATDLVPLVRVGVFAATARRVWQVARGGATPRVRLAVEAAAWLTLAWYVEGVHRSLLWGIDAALAAALLHGALAAARARVREGAPPLAALADAWTFGAVAKGALVVVALAAAVSFPLFWSTALCIVLAVALRRNA